MARSVCQQLAENVQRLRKAQELSLQQVADRARLSKSHVWAIEQGNSINPTVYTLLALAGALGCEPSLLVNEFSKTPLHPLAMRVAVDVDRAFRIAAEQTAKAAE